MYGMIVILTLGRNGNEKREFWRVIGYFPIFSEFYDQMRHPSLKLAMEKHHLPYGDDAGIASSWLLAPDPVASGRMIEKVLPLPGLL
jgi:hypothetical protein